MASHHHHAAPCYHTHCYCTPPPPPDPHLHFHQHTPNPYPYPYPHPHPHPQTHIPNQHHLSTPNLQCSFQEQETVSKTTLSSLLSRIAALETAIRRRSTSTSAHSLRDAAARVIQTRFRAFLLRRSRTLRQLKDLAFIKSELGFLKLLVSEKTHFDYDVVCRKVRGLLHSLADIQGGDPMIRDGKLAVSRDLNRFLDYIDGFYIERTRVSIGVNSRYTRNNLKSRGSNSERNVGNKRGGGLKQVNEEKLRGLAERIDKLAVKIDEDGDEMSDNRVVKTCGGILVNKSGGMVTQKPVKRVSFAEDGKLYTLVRRNLDEDNCDDSVDGEDLVDEREIEEIGLSAKETVNDEDGEAESEDGCSSRSSEGEKDLASYPRGKR